MLRSGARSGNNVYVTGTLGGSAVGNDELLLSESHLDDMRTSLARIHSRFAKLYNKSKDDELFAMEVEFKITKEGKFVIKQARPWVFNNVR